MSLINLNEETDCKVNCNGNDNNESISDEKHSDQSTSEINEDENNKNECEHSIENQTSPSIEKSLPLPMAEKPKALSLTASYSNPQPIGSNFVLNHLTYPCLADYQFSGTYYRYPEFASMVQTFIDSDSNLSDQLKYAALLKLTRNDANRYISGLFGPDQYQIAKKRLEYRYYRPVLILASIIEETASRQHNFLSKHKVFRLIRLNSDLDRAMKWFEQLEAEDKWMKKLLNTIINWLPKDVGQQFVKEFHSGSKLEDLFQFLNEIINSMETMEFLEQERRRR